MHGYWQEARGKRQKARGNLQATLHRTPKANNFQPSNLQPSNLQPSNLQPTLHRIAYGKAKGEQP
ncbi:hypothetical protein [Moorena sp. SIO3A2]|uniref:hypothetical protein n=1 Tax=Moorena sp. SIO3A2 TaxID=2607841 RepID=UPI0013B943DF|nr:hypothetical protein [Moorena sp. SIO3A2]NER86024.1 hypothetical protein [Moorena sp. SIO3A2]